MDGWVCPTCRRVWAPGTRGCEYCNIVASGGQPVVFFKMPVADEAEEKGSPDVPASDSPKEAPKPVSETRVGPYL